MAASCVCMFIGGKQAGPSVVVAMNAALRLRACARARVCLHLHPRCHLQPRCMHALLHKIQQTTHAHNTGLAAGTSTAVVRAYAKKAPPPPPPSDAGAGKEEELPKPTYTYASPG